MPLIEITNTHLLRAPSPYYYHVKHSKISFLSTNNNACNYNSFPKYNFNLPRSRLPFLIQAVAAAIVQPKCTHTDTDAPILQPNCSHTDIADHQPGIVIDLSEQPPDEREQLRRSRISKANKGKTPWNKGRKHSPETLQKIKERTLIAMQNPKVKMKLTNLGHAQTTETKLKISAGVRKRWEKKRGMNMVQETCCFEWQHFIAEASRRGLTAQEELQWNSYETLNAQLKQEWLESVEQRKLIPRAPSTNRSRNRAPKSPEQRKKISEAISAKWADPEYRERVISAFANRHSTERRKPRPRPDYSAQPPKRKKPNSTFVKSASTIVNPIKLRKRKSPAYKDPLVNSKLEMIKNIRAQRASVDTRQTQAIQQARLLIAEAEKAAKALEVAAENNPIAQSSLIETRKLIAEAIQSLESIDTEKTVESIDTEKTADCNVPSVSLKEEVNNENESTFEVGNHSQMVHVNGHTTLSSSVYKFSEDFGYLSLERPVNGDPELHLTNGCAFLPFSLNSQIIQHSPSDQERETEQYESSEDETLSRSESPAEDETLSRSESPAEDGTLSRSESPAEDETLSRSESPAEDETLSRSPITTKKWVRGRLVEVSEENQ